MAKIHTLKISNYRGIKKLEHVFDTKSFICLIGRGDSGKTTLLQAIAAVLSPNWDYKFYDSDFYEGKIENDIVIEASLYDLPDELLTDSKYGLHKRLLTSDNQIIDDLSEEDDQSRDILTVKLVVKEDLEPQWFVTNNRESQEDMEIRHADRRRLNVFIVSDYIDRHFTWGKGTPLYSLLKMDGNDFYTNNILLKAHRDAAKSVKELSTSSSGPIIDIIGNIKKTAGSIGLSLETIDAYIDFKNLLLNEGSVALHDDMGIPYRLKGKGTKRLLSIAIQLEIAKQKGGIILIDEIEQGLEPDRIKFLVRCLKESKNGQVFITTHSNNVLVELSAVDIFLKKKEEEKLIFFDEDFQGCLRNNPNAFFAKRVLVCEGATEVGICRALDDHRISDAQDNIELLGISLVDGKGNEFIKYCTKFKEAGYDVCAFCDSDLGDISDKKEELRDKGVIVVDCEKGNAIEQQLFQDLSWTKVLSLLEYAVVANKKMNILDQLDIKSFDELSDTKEYREKIGKKATKKGWFKRIDHGEKVGRIWFESLEELDGTTLGDEYEELMKWINKK